MSLPSASLLARLSYLAAAVFLLCSSSFFHLEYDSLQQSFEEEMQRPLTEQEKTELTRLQRALRELLSTESTAAEKQQAVVIFEELDKQGSARAAFCLGLCYLSGEGVESSLMEATNYLKKSAEEYPPAAYNLAILFWQLGQQNRAVEVLESELLALHPKAQYALGYALSQGTQVKKDPQRACKLFIRAAKLGHENARAAMIALLPTEVVERNRHKILPLLGQGVEQEHGPSLTAMGYVFGVGLLGALPDAQQAFEFFLQASAQEHAPAFYEISQCYEKGFGVAADAQRAQQWRLQAAVRHEPRALLHFAKQQADPVLAYAVSLRSQSTELVAYRRELIAQHGFIISEKARQKPQEFFRLGLGLEAQSEKPEGE